VLLYLYHPIQLRGVGRDSATRKSFVTCNYQLVSERIENLNTMSSIFCNIERERRKLWFKAAV
jgi:acyl-ACP thioesterase